VYVFLTIVKIIDSPTEREDRMFKLTIKMDNAAFEDREGEVARILREIANKVEAGYWSGTARDYNGNDVSTFKVKK